MVKVKCRVIVFPKPGFYEPVGLTGKDGPAVVVYYLYFKGGTKQ